MSIWKAILFTAALLALHAASSALVLTADAAPNKTASKRAQPKAGCKGTDMLAELAKTDPDRFEKVTAAAKASMNADAIFWKVSKPGRAPSYVFGTVHVTDPRVTTLSATVSNALTSASTLALEVADLSPTALASALLSAADVALYTDGTSLQSQLSAENFAIVERKLKSAGMPVHTARVFRPWVVTMLLASSDCERKRARSGKRVLDRKLADIAKKKNIPIVGLETLDQQLRSLSASSDKDQLAMLRAGLAYADRSDDLVETLLQLYLSRNIGATWPFQMALAEQVGVSADAYDSFYKNLITRRNRRMRDSALPLLENGNAFIAVGALHLPGDDGLVALLKNAGFDVTAVE